MIRDLYKKFVSGTGVSTDTRSIREGNIFFALKGPNFNANEFAEKALHSGASYAVVDDDRLAGSDKIILVEDVLKTLQQLALYHRKQLTFPILAITGSNGKTTTKELIRSVLEKKYRCQATEGNLNNHIGVPLTILGLRTETEIAIVEMGANKPGDVQELCQIAEPTHGIITNIGKAHTEGFGNFDGVLREKRELYHWLIQNKGVVFINSLDNILMDMSKRIGKPIFFPKSGDFYHCELVEADPWITIKTDHGDIIQTRLVGLYNFSNIAAALCIGKFFKVVPADAHEAVSLYVPSNNRSQILTAGTNTIILDAYNANPASMKAALENLQQMKADKKVVILGDMFELGDLTESEHRILGKVTRHAGLEEVIFCGERMRFAQEENRMARFFKTRPELENYLGNRKFKDCLILIKGSRAMALENIVNKIVEP